MKKSHLSFVAGCSLLCALAFAQPVTGASVGSVDVMEIEDVRDASKIARAKARNRAEDEDGFGGGGGASSSGCGNLEIGNVHTGGVGRRVPREVIVVVEGPVINENRCR